jgi:GAF domain-containing protein
MSGAGIMLISDETTRGPLSSTGEVSALLLQLHFDLGEGPCIDAFREDRPILEPDLVGSPTRRWIAFTSQAVEAGVRAAFAFPLRIGSARMGALCLHRDRPGPLTDDVHADCLVLTNVVSRSILLLQAGAPTGQIAATLEATSNFQYVVHQASGMVAAQLEVSVAHALTRLRAYAFGNDMALSDVAKLVIARSLRFDDRNDDEGFS